MSGRYHGEGDWTTARVDARADLWSGVETEPVRVEYRDLVDTRNGQRYEAGQYRVSGGGERARTYNGETAWCRAENEADRRVWRLRLGR
jgi:hypothetical protein